MICSFFQNLTFELGEGSGFGVGVGNPEPKKIFDFQGSCLKVGT